MPPLTDSPIHRGRRRSPIHQFTAGAAAHRFTDSPIHRGCRRSPIHRFTNSPRAPPLTDSPIHQFTAGAAAHRFTDKPRRLGFHLGSWPGGLGFHLGFCRAAWGFLEFAVTLEPPSRDPEILNPEAEALNPKPKSKLEG